MWPIVFAIAGLLLAGAAAYRYATRNAPCPADPSAAASCMRLRRSAGALLVLSVTVYAVGFVFAFMV